MHGFWTSRSSGCRKEKQTLSRVFLKLKVSSKVGAPQKREHFDSENLVTPPATTRHAIERSPTISPLNESCDMCENPD